MKTVIDTQGNFLFNTTDDNYVAQPGEVVVDFVPEVYEPTEEEIRQREIDEIKEKYEFHRKNGWNAYQNFRAIIVLDIQSGKLTETQAFLIEKDLKVGYDRISQNGDWKTAYYELSQVTVSYEFVQYYMDMALNYIANYIQNNYDS